MIKCKCSVFNSRVCCFVIDIIVYASLCYQNNSGTSIHKVHSVNTKAESEVLS